MQEYIIKAADGTGLFACNWLPEGQPCGIITLVHGIGEHSGRYGHIAEIFNKNGFVFNSFDLRGHGKSGGKRGYTPTKDSFMKDIDAILYDISEKYPGLPHFLYGHSMGGSLAINYVLREASKPDKKPVLTGLIATGPWLRLVSPPNGTVRLFANIMNVFNPSMQMDNNVDANQLSHVADIATKYASDELVHHKITPRMFTGVYKAGLWALDNAAAMPIPCLIMHGGADGITSPAASAQFASSAGQHCTFRQWEGLYHEIHNEAIYPEVVDFILKWIEGIMPGRV